MFSEVALSGATTSLHLCVCLYVCICIACLFHALVVAVGRAFVLFKCVAACVLVLAPPMFNLCGWSCDLVGLGTALLNMLSD